MEEYKGYRHHGELYTLAFLGPRPLTLFLLQMPNTPLLVGVIIVFRAHHACEIVLADKLFPLRMLKASTPGLGFRA